MRIIAISDTHCKHSFFSKELIKQYEIDNNAILIHAGDACLEGNKIEAEDFLTWFGSLPFKHKIFIPGNHDIPFEYKAYNLTYLEMEYLAKKNKVILLINNILNLEGLKIIGCSHTPFLKSWGFYSEEMDQERFYTYIDQDADIIISHNPPYGVGDTVLRHGVNNDYLVNLGCKHLLSYIERNNPKVVICGHIHEGYGNKKVKKTRVYNCSSLDEHYMSFNPITIIDL